MDFDRLLSGGSIIIRSLNAKKKGVKKRSEKIWGYVAGEGEFENRGQDPLGHPKRAQNIFEKNF